MQSAAALDKEYEYHNPLPNSSNSYTILNHTLTFDRRQLISLENPLIQNYIARIIDSTWPLRESVSRILFLWWGPSPVRDVTY